MGPALRSRTPRAPPVKTSFVSPPFPVDFHCPLTFAAKTSFSLPPFPVNFHCPLTFADVAVTVDVDEPLTESRDGVRCARTGDDVFADYHEEYRTQSATLVDEDSLALVLVEQQAAAAAAAGQVRTQQQHEQH